MLNSEEAVDLAPAQVYAGLLSIGVYLCSVRTMYRILKEKGQVRERRNQRKHPKAPKPKLRAHGPNQIWSWDITKLRGPSKGELYYLYVVLDIYSRCVVGWTLSRRESAATARDLFEQTLEKEGLAQGSVCVHSDRGAPMTSKTLNALFDELGVGVSYSRPRVPNDNPYSESQFKTLKYRPDYPARFDSLQDARQFCRPFFNWYNNEHFHSGLAYLTPQTVHRGQAAEEVSRRQAALEAAFRRTPERFPNGRPRHAMPPVEVWINEPQAAEIAGETGPASCGEGVVSSGVCKPGGPAEAGGFSTPRPLSTASPQRCA